MENLNIIWFKKDLRLHDHAPLSEAARQSQVILLYIIEPALWSLPDRSARHWHFIHDSLIDLQYELKKRYNASLVIRIGEAISILNDLYHKLGCFTLWSHQETGNHWTFTRDIAVSEWCREQSIIWHEYANNGIVRRLKNRDVWANMRNQRMIDLIIQPPTMIKTYDSVVSHELPAKNHSMFKGYSIGNVQQGGRENGLKVLESFLQERGENYMKTISKPGISARNCSRLSPHITFGTLSIREIEQATKSKITTLSDYHHPDAQYFSKNLSAFLSRLAWHCHFIQKLEQQPDIEFKSMHPAFEGMREPHFREDFFNAWKTGHTGYPLIDACMRSLHNNGWITFRMRAMLVSFASYHLWLDWKRTAPFLAQLFTDYEPGIHYAQFQMQSGVTGINTIRMYNPIKQSIDHANDGKFIRRFVPELKNIPDSFIHEPWKLENMPVSYPKPIVNHNEAIKHARAEISKRWKHEDFREQSSQIHQKLGSRHKPIKRQKKIIHENTRQMSLDF